MVEETGTTRTPEGNLGDEGGRVQEIGREEGFPEEGTLTTGRGGRVSRGPPVNQDEGHRAPTEGEARVGMAGEGDVSQEPEHSWWRVFCDSYGEECRDDMAGCHRCK